MGFVCVIVFSGFDTISAYRQTDYLAITAKFHYAGPTGPDPTTQSTDSVGDSGTPVLTGPLGPRGSQ